MKYRLPKMCVALLRMIPAVIIIALFTGCNQQTQTEKASDELDVLNQAFIHLVANEWYYEKTPPPMPLSDQSNQSDSLTFKTFSENRERAVFYYEFSCGRLCGWGCIVFVERKGDKWEVIRQREMWVS